MITDVLYALLGLTGDVIVEDGATFRLSSGLDTVSEAERQQIDTLVRLGWYYREFKSMSDIQHQDWKSRSGIYELAVFDGISDMISEYEMEIGFVEEQERVYGGATFSYILQHLQKFFAIFPEIYELMNDLLVKSIQGCQILHYLSDFSSGIPVVKSVIARLLNGVRAVFVKQVFSWMIYGELDEDFFVALNAEHSSSTNYNVSLSGRKSSSIFNSLKNFERSSNIVSGYVLLHQRVPASHVTPQLAAKILFAGKAVKLMMNVEGIAVNKSDTLSYLSRGGTGIVWPISGSTASPPSWSYRDQFESKMERVSTELHQIHRDPDNAVMLLEELIEEMYSTVSDHLWMLLKDRLGFMNYFYAMRNVYLLGKGELFQSILDQVVLLTVNHSNNSKAAVNNDGVWSGVLQNVAKSLGLDEESIADILRLNCKQKGSIHLQFSQQDGSGGENEEEMCLVGSVVRSNGSGRIVLCPSSSSVNFLSPVSVAAGVNVSTAMSAVSGAAAAADCYKGGVLFTDSKPITNGFSCSVNFTLSLNQPAAVSALQSQLDREEFDILLASLSLSLCPSVRELETCLLRNQSVHRVGTVTVGISIHAVKKRRSEPMFYQCQVFLTAGEVHRVTVIELDDEFHFLGSCLTKDEFTLQLEFLAPTNGSISASSKHPYLTKVRMVPAVDGGDLRHWSLEVPLDLTKHLPGGSAYLGVFGVAAQSRGQVTSPSTNATSIAGAEISLNLFSFQWKSVDPTLFVSASTYTAAKFPDTCRALDAEVVKICSYLSLQVQLKLPTVYQIVYDGEMIGCYRKIFTYLMKIRLIASLMEKLLIDHPGFVLDRVFCHLKHSMHFFINNLLYYLQVDVIDAQFSELEESLLSGTNFQSFLRNQRKFLAHTMKMSMMNNPALLQSINKVLHCCVRFISVCRLVEQLDSQNRSLFVPSEEYDDIRNCFFAEVKALLSVLRNVDNGGFLFRLDFNGYFSAQDV